MHYTLKMRDDGGSTEEVEFESESFASACLMISPKIRDWVNGGEWGDNGASVTVYWTLTDEDEDEDEGALVVDVEPNHEALIRAAGGDPDCDHDWSSEGEGGLDENPGVWSVGGTAMVFRSHCTKCGLQRRELSRGSQRNQGEHDEVSYSIPSEADE